jgi:hypothetical protein
MKKTFVVLNLLSLIASASALADCRQANLQSADGSQIAIDYASDNASDGNTTWVSPGIHVVLTGDKCSAQQVVVQLVRSQFGYSAAQPQTLTKDSQNPCEFSAAIDHLEVGNHGGALAQSIAVQVIYPNGGSEWLVDPISGAHNFKYAFQIDGYSPNPEVCQ